MTRPAPGTYRGSGRAALLAVCCAVAAATAPAAEPGPPPAAFAERLDTLVREGDDLPRQRLAAIEALAGARSASDRRRQLLAAGIVAARSGMEAEAEARAQRLRDGEDPTDLQYDAAAHLIRAELEENAGHAEAAYQQARAALRGYEPACAGAAAPAGSACDHRAWWRAQQMAHFGALGQGNLVVAETHLKALLEAARAAGDRPREVLALAMAALLAERNVDAVGANRLMGQAHHLARADGGRWLQVRLAIYDGLLAAMREQLEGTQRVLEEALPVARAAGSPRLEAALWANLSDVYVRRGQPARALVVAAQALAVARAHRDQRLERQLLHNATLARLALGRVAEARPGLARLLELWARDTGAAARAAALQEFGDALARAGDVTGALALFHQQEALEREIRATNKAAAEEAQRDRFDEAAQTRRIELLARDNQLKTTALDNRSLTRRLWAIAAAGGVLLAVLAVLMVLRMRELNRTLVQHERLLKAHSERDALTGLANRRQFREVMRLRDADRQFRGALLMIDIDHFKRINDRHGHAAGDRVLVEVARRLVLAVRDDDLVARWGGEEFLVFAPGVEGAELDQLADRVRLAIGQTPITVAADIALDITASVGYAAFPLPAAELPVTWEQAVNLADLSLYTAKNQGRNCAVGIVRTTARTRESLREVEADLARAHEDGRVTLKVLPEPLC